MLKVRLTMLILYVWEEKGRVKWSKEEKEE
jgi:hypothetical protein